MEGEGGGGHSRVTENRGEVEKVSWVKKVEGEKMESSEKVSRAKNNNVEECNLFYHHLPPLSLRDKLVLCVAGVFLVPIRSSQNLLSRNFFQQCCFQICPCSVGDAICLAREWLRPSVQRQRQF